MPHKIFFSYRKNKTPKKIFLIFFFLFQIAFLSCFFVHAEDLKNSVPIKVTDFRDKTITIQSPAKRIVCLIESALSGLYMLDAHEYLIGISTNVYQDSVYPYYAAMDSRIRNKELPAPGNWDFVNIEMLVALEPDLVIIWSHQEESIAAIEEKGIAVYGVFIESFKDIYNEIRALGTLTGTQKRAEELIDYVSSEIAVIQNSISQSAPNIQKRVYYMWAQGELQTSGQNSTVNELIELAGGKNVAGHISQEHLVVNMENIITWDPEVIVMWNNNRQGPEDIINNPMWRSVSAVKNHRVYEFPDVFSCDLWTLKYLYPVQLIANWCYPDHFKNLNLSEKKTILFQKLYGEKLNLSDIDNLQ